MNAQRLTRLMLIGCRPDSLKQDAHFLLDEAREKRDRFISGTSEYMCWNHSVREYYAEVRYLGSLNI